MRRPAKRGRAACAAVSAALTAALLLAGCTSTDHTSADTASTPSARPSVGRSPHPPRAHREPPAHRQQPRSVAALGDSISRGFDACSVLADCPKVSWVTGTDKRVESLAARLALRAPAAGRDAGGRAASGRAVGETVGNSWNLARSGARMSDLPGQVTAAVRKKPELVTILMGANDACRSSPEEMTPVAGFRREFESSLGALHRGLPRARVLVGSIPDLEHLWEVGRRNPLARTVWRLGICPSMLSRPDSTDPADTARRAEVERRVDAYNDVLKESCARYPSCTFDGGAVHDYRFSMWQLSPWDWFHPSVRGQAQLARILYRAAFAR
jgi:lysophospholipase L1-like esterase